jgi:hypothetical protein
MRGKLVMFLSLCIFCSSALAASAAWYKWTSKIDGKIICAQVSPGDGWEQHGGPYKDFHCSKLGVPGE